uniref:zinc finger domain-containing protein n=1 Tax=Xanthobacter albus TaxID=3119929 RepID=UPI00372D14DF
MARRLFLMPSGARRMRCAFCFRARIGPDCAGTAAPPPPSRLTAPCRGYLVMRLVCWAGAPNL